MAPGFQLRIDRLPHPVAGLVCLAVLPALLAAGCGATSNSAPPVVDDQQARRTQLLLQRHNAGVPIAQQGACLEEVKRLLADITGTQYVFTEFAAERWATGGRAAQFVPFQTPFGAGNITVTVVVDDSCKIQGLIWPE